MFGNLEGLFRETEQGLTVRRRLLRHFPEQGDTALCSQPIGSSGMLRGALRVTRADGCNTFRICSVWSVPVFPAGPSVQECLQQILHMGCQDVLRYVNHPSQKRLRQVDQDLYVILSLQHFRRGRPMLPHVGIEEPDVRICAESGLCDWTVFGEGAKPKFQAASYIQQFLKRLGHGVRTFNRLDGHNLVPYQCAIRRCQWRKVSQDFAQAFKLQRAAYRHFYGGCTAPDLREDTSACLRRERIQTTCFEHAPRLCFVVRRTFINIEEEHEDADLPMRKAKSLQVLGLH
mmetsp:Transcript_135747/g.321679  ORF Transcript_135747/g.321679 Transcript_135747/m.321679 type:complete len:288 (+) Transcript_135747:375-1238(+)